MTKRNHSTDSYATQPGPKPPPTLHRPRRNTGVPGGPLPTSPEQRRRMPRNSRANANPAYPNTILP
jgi:hypothetical protein